MNVLVTVEHDPAVVPEMAPGCAGLADTMERTIQR
jgi:hypothetical protein